MRMSAYERKVRGLVPRTNSTKSSEASIMVTDFNLDPEELLTVYRMETEFEFAGELRTFGPFCAAAYKPELEKVTWRYKRELQGPILEPHEDGIGFQISGTDYVCGMFANDRSFQMWRPWKNTWLELEMAGFRIAAYQVKRKHLKIGGRQVCWHPDNATHLRNLEYDEFAELCWREY